MNWQETYSKEIAPKLLKELGIKNISSVPKITKISVNVGIGSYMQKYKDYSNVVKNISAITGQKPVVVNSRIAISNFKLRKDMPVGIRTTLRKKKMQDFFEKLVHVVFPRIRDFRGFSPKCFDKNGNLTIGLKDYTAFPEIVPEDITRLHGLQITINTTAEDKDAALALFKAYGFPFKK